jgi:hypothetical protein
MGKFGGFYKGEKKKPKTKTAKGSGSLSTAPVFSLPKLIDKKKDKYK